MCARYGIEVDGFLLRRAFSYPIRPRYQLVYTLVVRNDPTAIILMLGGRMSTILTVHVASSTRQNDIVDPLRAIAMRFAVACVPA